MTSYDILSDLLIRMNSISQRLTRLETFEQPRFGFHKYKSSVQPILGANEQQVSFDTLLWSNGEVNLMPADTFVAPTAGRYLVVVRLEYTYEALFASLFNTRINHNDTYYHVESEKPSVTGLLFVKNVTVLNLAKDETITVEANNSGDVKIVNISGSADPYESYFMVSLL